MLIRNVTAEAGLICLFSFACTLYIHGNGAQSDWTLGCVALENGDIRELYDAVDVGTPVIIKP
ncbi:MAG TPA: L,D-transpeptidase [Pyrinomonadaceae bacterium]|nr:L,D-transpeptidase [Pyrinomonadaceae bacterium]